MPVKAKVDSLASGQMEMGQSWQMEMGQGWQESEQGHRLSFLLKNLKGSEEKGKNSSLEFDFEKESSHEQETSVLSQRMVKKYHI